MSKTRLSALLLAGPDSGAGYIDADYDVIEGEDVRIIDGPSDVASLNTQLARTARNPKAFLATLANTRVTGTQLPSALASHYETIADISKGLSNAMTKLEADYLRRPNQICGIRSGVLAPAATAAFSLSPSNGQSWYRVLNFAIADIDAPRSGLSSLKLGGLEHINSAQTAPAVVNAVPMIGFQIKESTNVHHLMPWVGDAFTNSVPVAGTFVNMTSAAAGTAFTFEILLQLGVQVDPCGQDYSVARNASQLIRANISKRMGYFLSAA